MLLQTARVVVAAQSRVVGLARVVCPSFKQLVAPSPDAEVEELSLVRRLVAGLALELLLLVREGLVRLGRVHRGR